MDWSSWFHGRLLKDSSKVTTNPSHKDSVAEKDEELLEVTQHLIHFAKSFTFDTFKNFPLQDDGDPYCGFDNSPSTSSNVRKDLSEWHERHATLVLSKVKIYVMPSPLEGIYFVLVKSHIAECELQAIRLAKLRRMAMGDEKSAGSSPFEVEMAETNHTESLAPDTPATP